MGCKVDNLGELLNIVLVQIKDTLMTSVQNCPVSMFCFQNPSKADTGDYKCSAKNKWGNDHTTFALG